MEHDPLFYQHILKKKADILKKKMGKFNRPKTHRDKTKYARKKLTLKELNDKLNDDEE